MREKIKDEYITNEEALAREFAIRFEFQEVINKLNLENNEAYLRVCKEVSVERRLREKRENEVSNLLSERASFARDITIHSTNLLTQKANLEDEVSALKQSQAQFDGVMIANFQAAQRITELERNMQAMQGELSFYRSKMSTGLPMKYNANLFHF